VQVHGRLLRAVGGQVLKVRRNKQFDLTPDGKNIKLVQTTDGTAVEADAYISTAPADLLK